MAELFKLDKSRISVNKCRSTRWRTNGSGRFSKREETIEFGGSADRAQPNIAVLIENSVEAGGETPDYCSTIFSGFLQGPNTGREFGDLEPRKGLCPTAL